MGKRFDKAILELQLVRKCFANSIRFAFLECFLGYAVSYAIAILQNISPAASATSVTHQDFIFKQIP